MRSSESEAKQTGQLDALIIGAGFSGLYQLLCLRDRLGLSVQVLEAGDGVGGTWYWNRYPGARCDSESHSYCYTFSKELLREWEWSERYPEQPEIMRYLNHVADRFDLKRDIRFGTRVMGARYDEAANRWHVTTETGERLTAQFLITAVGCLSTANVPKIPGLESFAGRWVHTGQWPHEGVDFTGKRVGLIGTGSTGIQAAPVIAETAAHLTVFQRTANYSVPARNVPLTPDFLRYVKENFPEIRRVMRSTPNGHAFVIEDRSVFDVTPEQRQALYEAAWETGGLQFRATFRDLLVDKAANDTAAEFIRNKIRQIVKDPATAAEARRHRPSLCGQAPADRHQLFRDLQSRQCVPGGCARRADRGNHAGRHPYAQRRIHARHHRLRDRLRCHDRPAAANRHPRARGHLVGRGLEGGPATTTLACKWRVSRTCSRSRARAARPCCATCRLPSSSMSNGSPIASLTCAQHGLERIEPRTEAMDGWVEQVNEAANATLLPQAHHSWYLGANVPGKPRVFMPYAGGMAHYREICTNIAAKGYAGFALS